MLNVQRAGHMLSPKKSAFLTAYKLTGTVSAAADAAKTNRQQHYRLIANDPEYRAEFEHAKAEFTESLEAEAATRARDGWLEPVFHEGQECGYKRKFSDTLMIFLLKANNPAKYRETIRQEITGVDGKPPMIELCFGTPPPERGAMNAEDIPPASLPAPDGTP